MRTSKDAPAALLADLPLFHGCHAEFIATIAAKADQVQLGSGDVLCVDHERRLLVVQQGFVEVSTGSAPPRRLGRGEVINLGGVLGIAKDTCDDQPSEEQVHWPFQARDTIKVHGYSGKPPVIFSERKRVLMLAERRSPNKKPQLSDDQLCLYNLCPTAAATSQIGTQTSIVSKGVRSSSMVLRGVSVEDSEVHLMAVPALVHDPAFFEDGACEIQASLSQYRFNCKQLISTWKVLTTFCGTSVFPDAPSEALWAVAEISERRTYEKGECIVCEGEISESWGAIIVIERGIADVEKVVGREGVAGKEVIGCLNSGAIIGDLCLIGAHIPKAATVRARSTVEVIAMPANKILSVLWRYPSIMLTMHSRLAEIAEFTKVRLPPRTMTLSSLDIFNTCTREFLRDLTSRSQRHSYFSGQRIGSDKTEQEMHIVEYGMCWVYDIKSSSRCGEIPVGSAAGNILRLGLVPKHEDTEIYAATPLVFILSVSKQGLDEAVQMNPRDAQLEGGVQTTPESVKHGCLIKNVPAFQACSSDFIAEISRFIRVTCYMPGQTLVVEGASDAKQMFVLRGGEVQVQKAGAELPERGKMTMLPGAVFGDLVMLGATRSRARTIRAMTFCQVYEIPRPAFLAALDSWPRERSVFEQLVLRHVTNKGSIQWPMLVGTSSHFTYLVNLYAERESIQVGHKDDKFLGKKAVLLLSGELTAMKKQGKEVLRLHAGDSFNEQVLLGFPAEDSLSLVPQCHCEVQLLCPEKWEKITSSVPEELPQVTACLQKICAEKAELVRGMQPGTSLRRCSIFRALSAELVQEVQPYLHQKIFQAQSNIVAAGIRGDCLHTILKGRAEARGDAVTLSFEEGSSFGMPVVLGITDFYPATIKACSISLVLLLHRQDFQTMLQARPEDLEKFEETFREAEQTNGEILWHRLNRKSAFLRQSTEEFLAVACQHARDEFYAPGDVIIQLGDPCVEGECPAFVLVSGKAEIEREHGIECGSLGLGEVFGEDGALGLSKVRARTVRASGIRGSITHCARLHGPELAKAWRQFPDERLRFEELSAARSTSDCKFSEKRQQWLDHNVIPTLKHIPLLNSCSFKMLSFLAEMLLPSTFNRGEIIAKAADTTDTMVILLEGIASIETASGEKVGDLKAGGTFGETAMMGLFNTWIATLRAQQCCSAVKLSARLLQIACENDASASNSFERLRSERRRQVDQGWPLINLQIGADCSDAGVQVVSLLTDQLRLKTGEIWHPVADSGPCGAFYSVLVHGSVTMELVDGGHHVTSLKSGSLIPEGLVASYKAQLRANKTCKVLRFARHDLLIGVHSSAAAGEWFDRFRLLEKETCEVLGTRLRNARGATNALSLHSCDLHPISWKSRGCLSSLADRWEKHLLVLERPRARLKSLRLDLTLKDAPGLDCTFSTSSPQLVGSSEQVQGMLDKGSTSRRRCSFSAGSTRSLTGEMALQPGQVQGLWPSVSGMVPKTNKRRSSKSNAESLDPPVLGGLCRRRNQIHISRISTI